MVQAETQEGTRGLALGQEPLGRGGDGQCLRNPKVALVSPGRGTHCAAELLCFRWLGADMRLDQISNTHTQQIWIQDLLASLSPFLQSRCRGRLEKEVRIVGLVSLACDQ